MHVLHLCDDLIFASRVAGTARDLGLTCATARDTSSLLKLASERGPALAIVDLANPGLALAEIVAAAPRVVAYGSHVDAAGLRAARDAGCAVVLPRSKFVEELPNSLLIWASAS